MTTNLETVYEKKLCQSKTIMKSLSCAKLWKLISIQNELNIKQTSLEEETADSFVRVFRKINILVIDLKGEKKKKYTKEGQWLLGSKGKNWQTKFSNSNQSKPPQRLSYVLVTAYCIKTAFLIT